MAEGENIWQTIKGLFLRRKPQSSAPLTVSSVPPNDPPENPVLTDISNVQTKQETTFTAGQEHIAPFTKERGAPTPESSPVEGLPKVAPFKVVAETLPSQPPPEKPTTRLRQTVPETPPVIKTPSSYRELTMEDLNKALRDRVPPRPK